MAKQDISQEQFIQICTEYGFEVKERPEPWRITKTWFLAYIPPNYDEAIAAFYIWHYNIVHAVFIIFFRNIKII